MIYILYKGSWEKCYGGHNPSICCIVLEPGSQCFRKCDGFASIAKCTNRKFLIVNKVVFRASSVWCRVKGDVGSCSSCCRVLPTLASSESVSREEAWWPFSDVHEATRRRRPPSSARPLPRITLYTQFLQKHYTDYIFPCIHVFLYIYTSCIYCIRRGTSYAIYVHDCTYLRVCHDG